MSFECSARDIDRTRAGQSVLVDVKGGCSQSRHPHLARLGHAQLSAVEGFPPGVTVADHERSELFLPICQAGEPLCGS